MYAFNVLDVGVIFFVLLRFSYAFSALHDAKYSVPQSHGCYMALSWCYKSESDLGNCGKQFS